MNFKPRISWFEGGYWTAVDLDEPAVVGHGLFQEAAYADWLERLHALNKTRRLGCDHAYEIADYGDGDVDLHVCTKCRHFWLEITK